MEGCIIDGVNIHMGTTRGMGLQDMGVGIVPITLMGIGKGENNR